MPRNTYARQYTDEDLVAMPRVNVELLDQVLDFIIEHPDEWDQASWGERSTDSPCGTTKCFAGHACAMAGERLVISDGELLLNGKRSGFFETAQKHLGLNYTEAHALFYDTIYTGDQDDSGWSRQQHKDAQLRNVKVEVERIRARAKAQDEAFNRLAQEFIDAAGLDDVVKPGYKCPESEQVMQGIKGGAGE